MLFSPYTVFWQINRLLALQRALHLGHQALNWRKRFTLIALVMFAADCLASGEIVSYRLEQRRLSEGFAAAVTSLSVTASFQGDADVHRNAEFIIRTRVLPNGAPMQLNSTLDAETISLTGNIKIRTLVLGSLGWQWPYTVAAEARIKDVRPFK